MLNLKSTRKIHLPKINFGSTSLEFARIPAEDDSLIRDIERSRGEAWSLTGDPDVSGLENFWNHVEDDLRQDNDRLQFSE